MFPLIVYIESISKGEECQRQPLKNKKLDVSSTPHSHSPHYGQLIHSFLTIMLKHPKLENIKSFNTINAQKIWLILILFIFL